jgi:hypothetical protein
VSAGLPGLGLGGLFFILSALLAPFVELVRTARGRSSVAAWRAAGRQFALALTMIAAVELALRLLYAFAEATGLGGPGPDRSLTVLPLLPIGITLGLLACVLGAAKAMALAATLRSRERQAAPASGVAPSHPRLLAGLGAVVVAWFVLLLVGVSDLSSLSSGQPRGEGPRPQPAPSPVTRADVRGIETAVERGSRSIGSSAPRQAGLRASQPEALRGGGGGGAAPRRPNGRGEDGPAAPQPAPPASAPAVPATPPPADAGPGDPGPPAHAGPPAGSGAPDHAGPPAEAGPPAGAGPPPGAGRGGAVSSI